MQSRYALMRRIGVVAKIRLVALLTLLLFVGGALCQVQKEPYKLGPEDVITLTIPDHVEWSGDFLIPADGILDLPLVGSTKVAGMSLGEIHELLRRALTDRVVEPEFTVVLKVPRTRRVYVEGNVKVAAAVDYKPGWRISECLAAAGGLDDKTQAIDCKVTVIRAETGKAETVSLLEVQSGVPNANLRVQPGDVVTFRAVEAIPAYVVGQVGKPGAYQMRLDNRGVMAAIALAGGLLQTASTAGITITHLNGEVQKVDLSRVILYGDKTPLPNLRSGDLLSVPELQSRIAISGLVKAPGVFPLPDGKIVRLSDAISLAGGWDTRRARMSKVAILRNDGGRMKRILVNYGLFLTKADESQNLALQAGDVIYVPETNSVDWSAVFNGLVSAYYVVNAVHTQ